MGARFDPEPPGSAGQRTQPAEEARHRHVVRYRGFVLLPQADLGWVVRPERSPMAILPFRVGDAALSEVKQLIDRKLSAIPG